MTLQNKLIRWGIVVSALLLVVFVMFEVEQKATFQSWNLPLSGKVIIIDPGHGGIDGGASVGSVIEKDITLPISLKLRDYLQEQGALVLMTRETDTDLADKRLKRVRNRKRSDLQNRAKFINESEADLYISIHVNAFPQKKSKGSQTFYSPKFEENQHLAKLIQTELRDSLNNTQREAKPLTNVFLVKKAEKPGVLVEVGFISNPDERINLQRKTYQDDLAVSIYSGIIKYFLKENN